MTTPTLTLYHNQAKNYWYARVYWAGGKRTAYRLKQASTEAEAAVALELFRAHQLPQLIRANQPAARDESEAGPRLRDLANWYLETHLPYLDRAEKTQAHYRRVIGDFLTFCSQRHIGRPQQVSTRIIQEWQKWLSEFRTRTDGRVARRDELLALRHWFDECVEAGELQERLDISWKIPKKAKSSRFRALSADELARFLASAREHIPDMYPTVAWLAHTGWRISDVLDFRAREVLPSGHIDRDQLKTSAQLLYPVTPALKAILDGALAGRDVKPDDHIFLDGAGRPWEYNQWAKRLEYFCRVRHGTMVCARDLRKTFGTRMAMDGCPPSVLKELMGHEDIAMALEYYVDVDLAAMGRWSEKFSQSLERASG